MIGSTSPQLIGVQRHKCSRISQFFFLYQKVDYSVTEPNSFPIEIDGVSPPTFVTWLSPKVVNYMFKI